MILGIDPKVDYAFKHLLGRESTRPLLMDVIDKVLNSPPGHQLQDIKLLNPFNAKETLDDKLSILDIKARDQAGRQFNVEMQVAVISLTPVSREQPVMKMCKLAQLRGWRFDRFWTWTLASN